MVMIGSIIVDNVHVLRPVRRPDEAHAALVVDADAMLSGTVCIDYRYEGNRRLPPRIAMRTGFRYPERIRHDSRDVEELHNDAPTGGGGSGAAGIGARHVGNHPARARKRRQRGGGFSRYHKVTPGTDLRAGGKLVPDAEDDRTSYWLS